MYHSIKELDGKDTGIVDITCHVVKINPIAKGNDKAWQSVLVSDGTAKIWLTLWEEIYFGIFQVGMQMRLRYCQLRINKYEIPELITGYLGYIDEVKMPKQEEVDSTQTT